MQPTSSTAAREPSCVAVWAPWLAAPLFALLPIGGCGLAAGLRPAAAHPPTATGVVTVPAAPVVPIVRIASRQVAPGPAAH